YEQALVQYDVVEAVGRGAPMAATGSVPVRVPINLLRRLDERCALREPRWLTGRRLSRPPASWWSAAQPGRRPADRSRRASPAASSPADRPPASERSCPAG